MECSPLLSAYPAKKFEFNCVSWPQGWRAVPGFILSKLPKNDFLFQIVIKYRDCFGEFIAGKHASTSEIRQKNHDKDIYKIN